MNSGAKFSPDERTVTVWVPLAFRKRGGRKRVVAPNGTDAPLLGPPGQVSTLVKAIARAHRWQRMLESGNYASIAELAAAEKINPSYLARVLRLTLLSPNMVEAILDGRSHQATPLEPLSGLVVWTSPAGGFSERLK
jgi:hypothetical protein